MPEDTKEEEKKPKINWWTIILVIIGIILVILILPRIKIDTKTWIFLGIIIIGITIYYYFTNVINQVKRQDIYKIIRQIQFNSAELVGKFLDTEHVEITEISPNNFLVHFVNDGIVFEVRDNFITGIEYTNLFNAKKDREKSVLYKEIVKEQKRKDLLLERAKKLGIELPEVV